MGTSVSTDRQGEVMWSDGWMISYLGELEIPSAVSYRWNSYYENVKFCTTTEKGCKGDYSITKGFLYEIIHHRVSLNSIFPLCIEIFHWSLPV